jgi:hypothetical protein
MHLYHGEVAGAPAASSAPSISVTALTPATTIDDEWRARIEAEITLLQAQVSRLQTLVGAVK